MQRYLWYSPRRATEYPSVRVNIIHSSKPVLEMTPVSTSHYALSHVLPRLGPRGHGDAGSRAKCTRTAQPSGGTSESYFSTPRYDHNNQIHVNSSLKKNNNNKKTHLTFIYRVGPCVKQVSLPLSFKHTVPLKSSNPPWMFYPCYVNDKVNVPKHLI